MSSLVVLHDVQKMFLQGNPLGQMSEEQQKAIATFVEDRCYFDSSDLLVTMDKIYYKSIMNNVADNIHCAVSSMFDFSENVQGVLQDITVEHCMQDFDAEDYLDEYDEEYDEEDDEDTEESFYDCGDDEEILLDGDDDSYSAVRQYIEDYESEVRDAFLDDYTNSDLTGFCVFEKDGSDWSNKLLEMPNPWITGGYSHIFCERYDTIEVVGTKMDTEMFTLIEVLKKKFNCDNIIVHKDLCSCTDCEDHSAIIKNLQSCGVTVS